MAEYRIPLEGGDVLVLSMRVESRVAQEIDAEGIGAALLNALGIARPTKGQARKARPAEEDADEWLARTSKDALKGLKDD